MINKDYHGFTLADALRDADAMVNEVRLTRSLVDAEFIVGHGVIRNGLFSLLNGYGFSPKPKLGNDGVIVCVIE